MDNIVETMPGTKMQQSLSGLKVWTGNAKYTKSHTETTMSGIVPILIELKAL